jgi:hypothetical protein
MCFTLVIIRAHPSWKRPGVSVDTKVFSTMRKLNNYVKKFEIEYREGYDLNDDVDIWNDDIVEEVVYSDSYMEMPAVEKRIIPCECSKLK